MSLCNFVIMTVLDLTSTRCSIKIKHDNYKNYTYNPVYCYSFCCKEDCCTWYITLSVYASFVVIVISIRLFILECWQCWKKQTTRNIGSQETVLMSSINDIYNRSYGTSMVNMGPPPPYNGDF